MFLDEARITVHGGKGGDGIVSWRREKYIDRGGPWGGDGGNGGNVIFLADPNTDTLSSFAEVKVFSASNGGNGGKNRKHGKNGDDLILRVPPGTVIKDAKSGEILADLTEKDQRVRLARGGKGGFGNAHFASSVRQAPDFAELGEEGEKQELNLELKLVADVGIIGYPSVGKSTLISVISASRPKIADYPFTTLVPNLGVVSIHDRSFIVCDVPGLIEGASEGKGLGHEFLRHIERCGVLLHVLDVSRDDVIADYHAIRRELEKYSNKLAEKHELVMLNKIDLLGDDAELFETELEKAGIPIFASVSSATTHGIRELLDALLPIVIEERETRAYIGEASIDTIHVIRPQLDSGRTHAFLIEENPKGTFIVRGKRIEQITKMTDWSKPGGVRRFRDIIERVGIRTSLERAGAIEGSKVLIGNVNVSSYWL